MATFCIILLSILSTLFPHAKNAEVFTNPFIILKAVRINHSIQITGHLSDPAWKEAHQVTLSNEFQPIDKHQALQKTKVLVLYNKSTLYIGFICKDTNPSKIRAHISDRDKIFNDDYVGAIIDPYDNNQHAYEFFVNPLGIQADAMRSGNHEDESFDALWYSKAAESDSGYTAVMAIPFKSLGFPNKKIQNWSVQFVRNYPRKNDYMFSWTYVNLNESCFLCQNGRLTGLRNVNSSNTVEFLPYAIATKSSGLNNTDDPTSGFNTGTIKPRVGGSVSYSPNSSLSLDAVFNPDFSQVETDATQISVNNTFAVSYPEKRPFFMQGASLFHTPFDIYYSRMISDPLTAGKFTEKSGDFSLAMLTAYDRNANFIIPGLEGSSEVTSNLQDYVNVLRPNFNFGSDSHIGGIITTRNIDQAHNYVASADWDVKVMDHYYFGGQTAIANTTELNNDSLSTQFDNRTFGHSNYDAAFNGQHYNGIAFRAGFERRAKYYTFRLRYRQLSPTFQAQEGFITQTNIRRYDVDQQINYYPGNAILDHGHFHVQGRLRYDYSGRLMSQNVSVDMFNQFTHQTGLYIGYSLVNNIRYDNILFRNLHHIHVGFHSNASDILSFGGHIDAGRYIYHDNPSLGKGYNLSGGITAKPTSRLHLHLSYDYSQLSSVSTGERYYSGSILRMTGIYNFSSKLFARLITQYDSFSKEFQVYPLIYYKLNPFTIFYAGMTDYMDNFGQPYGFRQTNREFFVKFQYLVRL